MSRRQWQPAPARYHTDHDVTLWLGDAEQTLRGLPAGSVQCIVTSPPYYQQRDYQIAGQLGRESTPRAYVAQLTRYLQACHRVLAADGTMWVNLGDSYAGKANRGRSVGRSRRADRAPVIPTRENSTADAPYRSLLLLPARVAIALTRSGAWALRNRVIWQKPNHMPESVTDRFTSSYEEVLVFSKGMGTGQRYYFDLDALREPPAGGPKPAAVGRSVKYPNEREGRRGHGSGAPARRSHPNGRNPGDYWQIPVLDADAPAAGAGAPLAVPAAAGAGAKWVERTEDYGAPRADGRRHTRSHPAGRNPGDYWQIPEDRPVDPVWRISTQPYPGAHTAIMPVTLARRCVIAGCPPGGTVLDPFSGAGTTLLAARALARRGIGIDLDPVNHDQAIRRLGGPPLDFADDAAPLVLPG